MSTRPSDVTAGIDQIAETGSGSVRTRRPVCADILSPCNHACPAGEDILVWLAYAQADRYHEVWLTRVRDNPLPGVPGWVCYHLCETGCSRQQFDNAVSIHAVERFLSDLEHGAFGAVFVAIGAHASKHVDITVLFTGYQAEGNRGAKMLGDAESVKNYSEWILVKPYVEAIRDHLRRTNRYRVEVAAYRSSLALWRPASSKWVGECCRWAPVTLASVSP